MDINMRYMLLLFLLMLTIVFYENKINEVEVTCKNEIQLSEKIADIFNNISDIPYDSSPKNEAISESKIISNYIKSKNTKLPIEVADIIAKQIILSSIKYNIDKSYIIGIIEAESTFNPMAYNIVRDKNKTVYVIGLMQVYKCDSVPIDRELLYDIAYNIDIGCQILCYKREIHNNNMKKAISSYSGNQRGYTNKVLTIASNFKIENNSYN
jgi:soluble lytic murein transglycosylase-like protein